MNCFFIQQDQGRSLRPKNIGEKRKRQSSVNQQLILESEEMALFSNEIWDKFDLGVAPEPVGDINLGLDTTLDDNFANIDDITKEFVLGEALVKPEIDDLFTNDNIPELLLKEEMLQDDNSCDFLTDFNLDASSFDIDTIKSDCMWSSTLNNDAHLSQQTSAKGRKRDFSLTLSEFNDAMSTSKDIEMLGSSPNFLSGSLLGSGLNPYIETPLNTSESDCDSTTVEEEIDVVSSDDGYDNPLLSSRQHHSNKAANHFKKVEPGKSLLLSSNRALKREEPQSTSLSQQAFIDHSYFLVRPPSPQSSNFAGVLTPNESSDDEAHVQFSSLTSSNIDKRKIAQAVQSLIRNNRQTLSTNKRPSAGSENIKFRFRMKFKSSGSQHSLLAVNNRPHHIRRKSASMNTHCPEPIGHHQLKAEPQKASPVKGGMRNVKSSRTSSGSSRSSPSNDQKNREIRDLHNSMERQRRVDLRHALDQLKSVVPELADVEKASKLNILNKASEYCKLLSGIDAKLRKEAEKEQARNAMLKKKLQAYQNQFGNTVRLSSGRIALVQSRSSF